MKVVVGGQLLKQEIADLVKEVSNGTIEAQVMNDIQAAMAVKTGAANYYIGACNTGGGGALAMAIGMLGYDNCKTIAMPGNILSDQEIIENVQSGKKAFGFTDTAYKQAVPVLVKEFIRLNDKGGC